MRPSFTIFLTENFLSMPPKVSAVSKYSAPAPWGFNMLNWKCIQNRRVDNPIKNLGQWLFWRANLTVHLTVKKMFFFTTPLLALFPIIILVSRQICGWLRSGLQRIFQVQLFLKNHLLHGPKAHLTSFRDLMHICVISQHGVEKYKQ